MPEPMAQAKSLDERFNGVYNELRRLASVISVGWENPTLNPTALVNEAYIKLKNSKEFSSISTAHFKRIAAGAMRQLLCDAARRKLAVKRGDGRVPLPLDEQVESNTWSLEDLMILDDLLERFRSLDSQGAEIVEFRFYGGLTDDETAQELGVSRPTVERKWRVARAWLGQHFDD